mgnify:CR=1 FL=1
MPPLRRQLFVDADLDLSVDGHPVAIRGDGARVTIAVDSAATAYRLFQARRPGRHLVRALTEVVSGGELTDDESGSADREREGPRTATGRRQRESALAAWSTA